MVVPSLVTGVSLLTMSDSIDVKMLSGAPYEFMTVKTEVTTGKRVVDMFSFSLSSSVAWSSHDEIRLQVAAAYAGDTFTRESHSILVADLAALP